MGQDSKIEWCDDTWNPGVGCTKVSQGCANCYMMRDQARYGQDGTVVRRTAPSWPLTADAELPLPGWPSVGAS